jgi:hypothetical protein
MLPENILKLNVFLCIALCALSRSAPCQDVAPQAAIPTSSSAPLDNAADDHRMNYKTINDPAQPVVALSAGEKFELVKHYFDPFTFVFTSITAGLEQVSNEKESYGQRAMGFAKRYGADFTDGFTNELFVTGVFPSPLHEPALLPAGTR